jgi:hypothetical protein
MSVRRLKRFAAHGAMNRFCIIVTLLLGLNTAFASGARAATLEELLKNDWEPFSVVTDEVTANDFGAAPQRGYSVFLRRAGQIAVCGWVRGEFFKKFDCEMRGKKQSP